jgi:hypothetical protein
MRFLVDTIDDEPELVRAQVAYILLGVVGTNRWLANKHGSRIPPLYQSGVTYQIEPWAEDYQSASHCLEVMARGWGECKSLAAWRLAELRNAASSEDEALRYGLHIYPRDLKIGSRKVRLFHVQVRHPNGDIEDPSYEIEQRMSA